MHISDFIQEQLNTEPADSKKYRMVSRGMYYIMSLFTASAFACYWKPEIAGHIAPLAQMAITAIGGLVAVYAGAQAAVEFKANSVLQTSQENKLEQCPDHVVQEGASGAPATKPFGAAAV